jgi:hypothetical protein
MTADKATSASDENAFLFHEDRSPIKYSFINNIYR